VGIVAVGSSDADLAMAINRVIQNQGGLSLVSNGKILVDIPFPAGGYISERRIEVLARGMEAFDKEVIALGSTLNYPLLTLCTLTSAAIPFVRITKRGYFRFRENALVTV
jgi:adenine deaminase